jgi:cytochrome P450
MLRHPEIFKKVQHEVRKGTPQDSVLLQACIKETSRFYSGMKMLRLAKKEITVPGTTVTVPKNSVVSISPYLTHHDPANFSHPDIWDPYRWIDQKGQLIHIDNRGSSGVGYMPFGAGSHRCVGEKIAGIIVIRSISTMIGLYDIQWADERLPKTLDFSALDFSKIGSPWLIGSKAKVTLRPRTDSGIL